GAGNGHVTPSAAAPVRGSNPSSSALPSSPQHAESMAAKSEWSCPICRDDQDDMAYMSPCFHQFCLGCALRWAWQKPNCPLCRSGTTAVLFSVWSDDDYLVFDVPRPAEPPAQDGQDEQGAVWLMALAQAILVSLTVRVALLLPPGLPSVLRPPAPSGVHCSRGSVGRLEGAGVQPRSSLLGEGVGC
uniref:RING-type E3 ubiquitin transferase n=1 Tax=Aquila chrysaetos chrysaetos TaxID=223781 RepID=A0A663EZL3_AQUCH